ncbi:MAG: DUF222 domain-containing protein, partial [Hamadaea sp.]|nr:DUF222 domain-containing protein [Hamadaea sp.]
MSTGVLAQAEADVAELAAGPLWTLSDAEITDEVRRTFALMQRLSARMLALVGTAEGREVPYTAGATGTANWLTFLLAIRHRDAEQWAKLARQLPAVPAAEQALSDGQVNVGQAQVITKTVHDLPSAVGEQGKAKAAEVLTKLAAEERLRPEVLEKYRSQILELVAPEIAEERLRKELERAERSAHDRRDFTLIPYGEGEYRIRGVLDAEMAAILRAALDPLSAPRRPAPTAVADQTLSGDRPDLPDFSGGQSDLGAPYGGDGDRSAFGGSGPARGGGRGAAPDVFGSTAAGDSASAGCPVTTAGNLNGTAKRALPGDPDLRSAGARRADALIELCERILHAGELPDNGGEKPHLTITLPWEQLKA